ncbi:hypothetical protein ACN27F_27040 [Solwaraspora sp. WMMB335]|uniref:hypothetical protein n=1 Tax=Solwaraspora sp. WMMB335 TaxID=3404118 RepID=UPI003B936586
MIAVDTRRQAETVTALAGCGSHNAGDTPDGWRAVHLFAGLDRDRAPQTWSCRTSGHCPGSRPPRWPVVPATEYRACRTGPVGVTAQK